MPTQHKGPFWRTVPRWIRNALTIVLLLIVLAVPVASAQAITRAELQAISREKVESLFGTPIPSDRFVTIPEGAVPGETTAKQTGIVVCYQSAPRCDRAAPNRDQGIEFRLADLVHQDNGGGNNVWSFVYGPVVDGRPVDSPLSFVYRSNTGGGGDTWGLVLGDPGSDPELDNQVAQLDGFGDSPLAQFLDDQTTEDGKRWAETSGVTVTTDHSDFAQRALEDPFMKAVDKAAEVVNSVNAAIVDALLWTVDQSNPTEVKGLGEAWATVRDLINGLFIIILIAMALLTIVRIDPQKYQVRKVLPLLIFAVISVNFSFFLGTVLADTAYVLSQPFIESAKTIIERSGDLGSGFTAGADSFGEAMVLLLAALLLLIALIVLLFFFIIRIIVVWLLAALSPVIFLFMVLPLTQGESKKLLQQWVRWVYMAPIAFLILYIGSRVAFPNPGQDESADAILSALFYAGVIIAAVLVPLALGGRAMSMAAARGAGLGKVGAKGGVGAVGLVPAGRGRTVGQRVREGRAFIEQRKANLEHRASLTAANAQLGLARRPFGAAITGMDEGIRTSVQDKLLTDKEKELMPYSVAAKYRITKAWQFGTGHDGHGVYALDNEGNNAGYLSREELALSRDRVAAGAAYKSLAQSDLSELYQLEQPGVGGRNFAWTGGQQLHRGDPVIGSYELNGRLNERSMKIKAFHLDADGVKGLDTSFLGRARRGDRRALAAMREIDEVRLGNAVDAEHRNKFTNTTKMDHVYDIARRGLLSKSVDMADFAHIKDAKKRKAAFEAEIAAQEHKEKVIINSYEAGQDKLLGNRPRRGANPRARRPIAPPN